MINYVCGDSFSYVLSKRLFKTDDPDSQPKYTRGTEQSSATKRLNYDKFQSESNIDIKNESSIEIKKESVDNIEEIGRRKPYAAQRCWNCRNKHSKL